MEIRSKVHEFKKEKLGTFIENGRIFLFFKRIEQAALKLWDGPVGVGNLLPFSKLRSSGDKLHYEMPMAGDRSVFARHRRKLLHPSSRSYFSRQALPATA